MCGMSPYFVRVASVVGCMVTVAVVGAVRVRKRFQRHSAAVDVTRNAVEWVPGTVHDVRVLCHRAAVLFGGESVRTDRWQSRRWRDERHVCVHEQYRLVVDAT